MGRRKRSAWSDEDSSSGGSSDGEWTPSPKKKSKSTQPPKQPLTKAAISILATDITPDQTDVREKLGKIDSAVLGRMKKALALASHEGTSEQEAKAALRMASKLMSQYSVTQADILSQESDTEKLKRAGTSVVSVRSTVGSTMVRYQEWAGHVCSAMETFFDFEYSFYGLAEQTVAAAYAFEMAYNLIMDWSIKNKIAKGVHGKNAYRIGVGCGLWRLAEKEKKQERKNAVTHEKRLLEARKKAELEEDVRRLDRLRQPKVEQDIQDDKTSAKIKTEEKHEQASNSVDRGQVEQGCRVKVEEVDDEDMPPPPPPLWSRESVTKVESDAVPEFPMTNGGGYDASLDNGDDTDSDNEFPDFMPAPDFNDDDTMDFEALDSKVFPTPSGSGTHETMQPSSSQINAKAPKEEEDDSPWKSVGQLIAFRESSIAIADDYLKTQGIKLSKHAASRFSLKDRDSERSYRQGVEDAAKIDVRRRRLKGAEDID